MNYYSGLWKVKSKGAVLTLVLHYLASSATLTLYWLFAETYDFKRSSVFNVYGPAGVAGVLLAVCSPITGWLADVHFGRYKVLRVGLYFMWIGSLIMTATKLAGYGFGDFFKCQRILQGAGGLLGLALFSIGLSAYAVNTLQFGIDQMPDASSDELSAYIHWFVWVFFAGDLSGRSAHLIRYCAPKYFIGDTIQMMMPNVMLSLALCCIFLLNGWFIIQPGSSNSLTAVLKVLKFAAAHKRPIRRRAITYSEDERPSRIDFAKDKYGGPFMTEQVEDVKTVFRMVLVIVLTTVLVVPLVLFGLSWDYLLSRVSQGICTLESLKLSCSVQLVAVTIIPLYTFVVYPLMRKSMLKMLQRVVIAAALTVIMSGAVLIIDSIKHAQDPDITCMFSSSSSAHMLKPDLWMTIPINLSLAIEGVLYLIAILEFSCAQSPYNMRGLLIGLVFSTYFFTLLISFGILIAWSFFREDIPPSCGFYYFLFQFVFAVIGLVVIGIAARWYKRRRRQEEDDQQRIVEGIYDRMLRAQGLCRGSGMKED